ncbi:MAG: hypothetical protein U0269_15210 [Polyangiales bacterium]
MPVARFSLFAATAATALVSAGTALGRLESRAWIAGALSGYVALVALGISKPALRMFTDALTRVDHGAALVVDVREGDADPLSELFALCQKHRCTITVALDTNAAIAHADVLRGALAQGHSIALRDGVPATTSSEGARAADRRIERIERDEARWAARLPELDSPELWLADGLFTPALQRIADAFDRTLVAPSHDLRAIVEPEALREKLVDALDHHAIVRVIDSPALRQQLPAVLDSAGRLGVPVRALTLPDHD